LFVEELVKRGERVRVLDNFSTRKRQNIKTFLDKSELIEGGHAIVAVGYDDKMKIKNTQNKVETTGALLIRNSWGTGWGEDGYGWLPYEYIHKGLADNFWSILNKEWIDTGAFSE